MKFPLIPQKKQTVTFHLKSGAELTFKCTRITTKVNSEQELVSYEIAGGDCKNAHYIRLDDISAITVKP